MILIADDDPSVTASLALVLKQAVQAHSPILVQKPQAVAACQPDVQSREIEGRHVLHARGFRSFGSYLHAVQVDQVQMNFSMGQTDAIQTEMADVEIPMVEAVVMDSTGDICHRTHHTAFYRERGRIACPVAAEILQRIKDASRPLQKK